jgi:hypothetical protein
MVLRRTNGSLPLMQLRDEMNRLTSFFYSGATRERQSAYLR